VADVVEELLVLVETSKALRDRPLRAKPLRLLKLRDKQLVKASPRALPQAKARDSRAVCSIRTTPATRALVLNSPLPVLLASKDVLLLSPEALRLKPRRLLPLP
jgi:hypothetical protein